ncbi:hypothetical protein Hanom_Chr09g00830201 [Helianthus anomalus]
MLFSCLFFRLILNDTGTHRPDHGMLFSCLFFRLKLLTPLQCAGNPITCRPMTRFLFGDTFKQNR